MSEESSVDSLVPDVDGAAQDSKLTTSNSRSSRSQKSYANDVSRNRSERQGSTPLQLQIRSDRKRFYREKKTDNMIAANRIAESRFNALRRDDYCTASIGPGRNNYKDKKSASNRNIRSKSVDQKIEKIHSEGIGSESFLQSGRGALEIADSFLNGNLFQRLLRSAPDSNSSLSNEYSDQNQNDKEQRVGKKINSSREDKYHFAPVWKEGSDRFTSNRPGNESILPDKADADTVYNLLPQYLDGWKATKGGWVSDFGPIHTHTLSSVSISSKRHTASLISGERIERRKSTEDISNGRRAATIIDKEEHGNSNYFEDRHEEEENDNITLSDQRNHEEPRAITDPGFSLLQHIREQRDRT